MCGITGCVGDISPNSLRKMTDIISHRGPDFQSFESIDNVHFGHTRLSILDLNDSSNQPLWDANKLACIVFNGEIYNFKILKKELIKKGYIFKSSGDTEVLVNMYLEYGVSMFRKLNGIFALAIWDTRTKNLIIAKDHFGVKPLYYSCNNNGFFFSSEIKSILASNKIQKEININSLYRSLVFMWSPGKETIFKNIFKVSPGHYMIITDGNINEDVCYWEWPEYKPNKLSLSENKDMICKSLEESIKSQLISDVPIGTFLSGGLDSSLITSIASKSKDIVIESFTIDTNLDKKNGDGFINDLPYAKKVSDDLSVPLNIVKSEPDIINDLPKMVYHLEELQSDPAGINVMMITKLAKSKGIKVLLSGTGGDDIFSGYRRHFAIMFEKYWSFLPNFIRKHIKLLSSKFSNFGPKGRRIAKAFSYADISSDERLISYFYWIDPVKAKNLFVDDISKNLNKNILNSPIKDSLKKIKTQNSLERMLHIEKSHFLSDHNLPYTDKMSMANGIEVRVPFLDENLLQSASQINSKLKQKKSEGKWILKKVAEKFISKKVIYRSKTGFGAPLRFWLNNELRDYVDFYLSEVNIKKRGIFKYEEIKKLINDDRKGIGDYSYTIFALLYLEIWFETFMDNNNLKQVSIRKNN